MRNGYWDKINWSINRRRIGKGASLAYSWSHWGGVGKWGREHHLVAAASWPWEPRAALDIAQRRKSEGASFKAERTFISMVYLQIASTEGLICKITFYILFSDLFPDYKSSRFWNWVRYLFYMFQYPANVRPIRRTLKYGVKFNSDF